MKNKEMTVLNVQEQRKINGGSINPPGVIQFIYDVLRGVFTPMV